MHLGQDLSKILEHKIVTTCIQSSDSHFFKVPKDKCGETPNFYGGQHFYSFFLNTSENSVICLPIILNKIFGAQKNRLIETALLSTHTICFDEKLEAYFLIMHSYLCSLTTTL